MVLLRQSRPDSYVGDWAPEIQQWVEDPIFFVSGEGWENPPGEVPSVKFNQGRSSIIIPVGKLLIYCHFLHVFPFSCCCPCLSEFFLSCLMRFFPPVFVLASEVDKLSDREEVHI